MQKPTGPFFKLEDFVPSLRQEFEQRPFNPDKIILAAIPVANPDEHRAFVPAAILRLNVRVILQKTLDRQRLGVVHKMRSNFFGWLSVLIFPGLMAHSAEPVRTGANVPVEISLSAQRRHADPFNDVTLDVIFAEPDGTTRRVPAFWAGGSEWKARYASPHTGAHSWRSECSDTGDAGLHGVAGGLQITAYTGDNPLFKHGPVHVAAGRRHFEYADGTPFLWLGDTWWMGLCHRLHWPDEFQRLAADRRAKGFNVIQIVAGLYPDMPPFDRRGANEAGFPWETNYARIRPEYFDAADARLRYLVEQGFTPCIVGAWGYFLPWMGEARMKAHWRYLIARYGAWPVIWCAAGEANLPWYGAKGFPFDDQQQAKGWCEVLRFIRSTDPWHRPLTVHPTAINAYTARHVAEAATLIDFDFLQTPHGRREAAPVATRAVQESLAASPTMPVINGEASYEMLSDRLPTEWTRAMFWLCMSSGAAGHTYGANGIWQCNRRGEPHGPSPTAGSPPTGYGIIPWDEAMNLPGSRQIGAAKNWLEKLPWWRFEPHPEWAVWDSADSKPPAFGSWIWLEKEADKSAPVAPRWFRSSFDLPAAGKWKRAWLRVSADDKFVAWVNGHQAAESASWKEPALVDVTAHLQGGRNVLALRAENSPSSVTANPAGLNAALEIEFADGHTQRIVTGPDWRASSSAPEDWREASFDDSGWRPAAVLAAYGSGPWGKIESESAIAPCVVGQAGGPRIIYLLDPKPVLLRQLAPGRTYRVSHFDPVEGREGNDSTLIADAKGEAHLPAPAHGHDHAWLIIPLP